MACLCCVTAQVFSPFFEIKHERERKMLRTILCRCCLYSTYCIYVYYYKYFTKRPVYFYDGFVLHIRRVIEWSSDAVIVKELRTKSTFLSLLQKMCFFVSFATCPQSLNSRCFSILICGYIHV